MKYDVKKTSITLIRVENRFRRVETVEIGLKKEEPDPSKPNWSPKSQDESFQAAEPKECLSTGVPCVTKGEGCIVVLFSGRGRGVRVVSHG